MGKSSKKILVLILLLIIFGIYGYNFNYTMYMYSKKNIDTESLNSLIGDTDADATIYIGRKTCPVCKELLPKLKKVFKNEQKVVYYYDTDKNRDDKLFLTVMENLEVDKVPTVLIFERGRIIKILDSQGIREY